MIPLVLAACSGDDLRERGPRECDAKGEQRMVLVRSLKFVREADGVSDGFDLDGVATADGAPDGCGIPDLVAPDGTGGIDNAFAYLLPALEQTEAQAVEPLVNQAIADGNLLVTIELSELDDEVDDACADLVVGRGAGVPMVGSDGALLPGQTIERDVEAPTFETDAEIVDGTFEVPLEILLPVQIFAVDLQFQLRDGRLRGTLHDDGTVTGVFGGGVDVDYLMQIVREENVDPSLEGILGGLLALWSDLAPDDTGTCKQLSMAFEYEAVPAYFFE